MPNTPEFEVEAAMIAGAALAEPRTVAGADYAVLPPGYTKADLESYHPAPRRIRTKMNAEQAVSFCEYFNRFKTPDSLLFASREQGVIAGGLDYHAANTGQTVAGPSWCSHWAFYKPQHSIEWKRWSGVDGQPMNQSALAQFLEENALDIREPASADVLEVCRSLQIKRKVAYESGMTLQNGNQAIQYIEQDDAKTKGDIEVPQKLVLGIPVYFGGDAWKVEVWLRYRLSEGKLGFILQIHRKEYLLEDAFKAVVGQIESLCSIKALYGKTEGINR